MKAKTFTVDEANKTIPKVKGMFDDIFVLRKKIEIINNEMKWLLDFWGKDLRDSDNPDCDRYDDLAVKAEHLHGEIAEKIIKIERHGCIVKDVDAGLVDFYSIIDDELVFLCWQYGEKEVMYWHSLNSGYRRRKQFSETV
jgi:hypothetical protein